ncbi:MAG: BCAM0308 family protein [bacterium]
MSRQDSPNHRHEKSGKRDTDDSGDPYLNEQPEKEPAVCEECNNIYENKQWYLPTRSDLDPDQIEEKVVCPGCRKVSDNYYHGELMISGKFVVPHRKEISHLIENEVARGQEKNPLQKLVEVSEEEGEIVVRTTNGKLAERLGRALHRAYKGNIEIEKTEKPTRVYWERNSLPE